MGRGEKQERRVGKETRRDRNKQASQLLEVNLKPSNTEKRPEGFISLAYQPEGMVSSDWLVMMSANNLPFSGKQIYVAEGRKTEKQARRKRREQGIMKG